jgi:hypothetical protein
MTTRVAGEPGTLSQTFALHVVPVDQVAPHESHHGRRVADLAARLVTDGRLVNPPVTAAVGEKYVLLDGATRLTALRELGYPHIVVQAVDLERQQIELHTWYHVVRGGGSATLLRILHEVPGLQLTPRPLGPLVNPFFGEGVMGRFLAAERIIGHLVTAEGQGFALVAAPETVVDGDWLDVLNRMVESYGLWGNVERALNAEVGPLVGQYPDLAAVVRFPQFTPRQVLALAAQGRTLPAGITRFVIPGRILRLNVPLDWLGSPEPLSTKQARLDELLRERLVHRRVRYYEEPVLLLDD